jgi:hypothetical protein
VFSELVPSQQALAQALTTQPDIVQNVPTVFIAEVFVDLGGKLQCCVTRGRRFCHCGKISSLHGDRELVL